VLALGFGVFLMGTLYQVQHNLLRSLGMRLEQARANVVFFDVQEQQRPVIDSMIHDNRYELLDETPIVAMRIASVNSRPVASLLADSVRPRRAPWALRREFRSTYRDTLVGSERIVEGRWFAASARDTVGEVSLERDVARELRVKLGDTITWNVQGVMIPTRITSLREVTWASFTPNFFAVFNSAALSAAPKQFVILGRAPTAQAVARLQRDVVSRFPTVSSLDLTLVQQTISNVLGKITMAIRFLALISMALGVPVLFSAVAATRRERLREGVLLKTLGATRRQVGRIMLAEYALLGTLGALTGVLLSTAGGWALMHWIFKLAFTPATAPALLVAVAMIGLAVAIGLLTGRDVFAETPMAALRES
jgi:putative ABC transport system permease protein